MIRTSTRLVKLTPKAYEHSCLPTGEYRRVFYHFYQRSKEWQEAEKDSVIYYMTNYLIKNREFINSFDDVKRYCDRLCYWLITPEHRAVVHQIGYKLGVGILATKNVKGDFNKVKRAVLLKAFKNN